MLRSRKFALDPHKAQLCISEHPHHDKRTDLRIRSQNRGHLPNFLELAPQSMITKCVYF